MFNTSIEVFGITWTAEYAKDSVIITVKDSPEFRIQDFNVDSNESFEERIRTKYIIGFFSQTIHSFSTSPTYATVSFKGVHYEVFLNFDTIEFKHRVFKIAFAIEDEPRAFIGYLAEAHEEFLELDLGKPYNPVFFGPEEYEYLTSLRGVTGVRSHDDSMVIRFESRRSLDYAISKWSEYDLSSYELEISEHYQKITIR